MTVRASWRLFATGPRLLQLHQKPRSLERFDRYRTTGGPNVPAKLRHPFQHHQGERERLLEAQGRILFML